MNILWWISHSLLPAVTRRSPPQSTQPSHSPRPVSLQWRGGPPLLATAHLTDSVTRHCRCAKAEVYAIVRIWNTLIAIFWTPWSQYYVCSYINSYMNSYSEDSHTWIHIWVHIWIHKKCFHTWIHIWIHMCKYEFIYEFIYKNSSTGHFLVHP